MQRIAIAVAFTITACAPAVEAQPQSGRYEQLDVAIAPDGRVTGRFLEELGEGVVQTCTFTLTGRLDARGVATVSATDGDGAPRRGRLAFKGAETMLTIPGARQFDGCGNALGPEIDRGVPFSRTAPAAWVGLAEVAAARAALRTSEGGGASRGYLVRGDVVGVLRRTPNALLVEFLSFNRDAKLRRATGWVRVGEVRTVGP